MLFKVTAGGLLLFFNCISGADRFVFVYFNSRVRVPCGRRLFRRVSKETIFGSEIQVKMLTLSSTKSARNTELEDGCSAGLVNAPTPPPVSKIKFSIV